MSDFTQGICNGFGEDEVPKDPTEKQTQIFARLKKVNMDEAWRMLRGEQMIGKFALQATLGTLLIPSRKEFGETDRPAPGTVVSMVESSKRAKQAAMLKMIRKCMNAIYSVTSYSYFRDDLNSNDMPQCINPQEVMYSRPHNKWDRVMLLVMDQAKVTLLPLAQKTLNEMVQHHDIRAFQRWHSLYRG